jgi:hemerythrin-like domain-containing protein
LHREITALRKAQTPPLTARYDLLMRECLHLNQNLERQQQELDRMATTFDASWEEQLWRLRVEQEVFSCQRADVMTLLNELKHLSQLAGQLEPYIRSLTPAQQSSQSESAAEQSQQMQSLLEHFSEYVSYLRRRSVSL